MSDVIFFDTDCLSSFLWADSEYILVYSFGSNMQVPRQVYNELIIVEPLKFRVNKLIKEKKIQIIDFLFTEPEEDLYYMLIEEEEPGIGKGEASAIALAINRNGILASNNLRDVMRYVEKYKLKHITTAAILEDALHNNLITISEGEAIWRKMSVHNRWLPAATFAEYLKLK